MYFPSYTIKAQRSSAAAGVAAAARWLFFVMLVNSAHHRAFASTDGSLMHHVTLDQHGDYVLSWTPEETHVTLEVQVKTRGWIGFGFTSSGSMIGADLIMIWINAAGEVHLSDRHGIGFVTPVIDDSQDVELIHGFNNATHTTIRFRRAWDTCDKKDDFVITGDTVRVIWAYDDEVPASAFTQTLNHAHMGVKSLYMMEPPVTLLEPSEDVQFFDMVAPNVNVPQNISTFYWCKLFKIPLMEQKNHYIGYKTLIQPGHEALVHHMLLYECAMDDSAKYLEQWVASDGAQCYSPNMPLSWNACSNPLVGWAVGGEGQTLPPHVGFPLGEEHDGATYFMLEIHYDNPEKLKSLVDASGFRLFHTKKLRQHEAGFFRVGHYVEPLHLIGPNMPWTTLGHCLAGCTSKMFPKEGVNVLASFLHSHLLGRAITLRQIRDGKELPPIFQDNHYDFNYQEMHMLRKERTILPGDHLITECKYDNTGIMHPTFGGLATNDEMCLSFVQYYPKTNLTLCVSHPNLQQLLGSMGVKELYNPERLSGVEEFDFQDNMVDSEAELATIRKLSKMQPGDNATDFRFYHLLYLVKIKEPQVLNGISLLELLFSPRFWTNATIAAIQDVVMHGKIDGACKTKGQRTVPGFEGTQEMPKFEPYVPDLGAFCRDRERMGRTSQDANEEKTGGEGESEDGQVDDEDEISLAEGEENNENADDGTVAEDAGEYDDDEEEKAEVDHTREAVEEALPFYTTVKYSIFLMHIGKINGQNKG